MTIIETAKITSKGQVTIPNRVRKLLHLGQGASVAFGVTREGVVLMPCEVKPRSPYTPKEWEKIGKLASEKGKSFSGADAARKHLAGL
ncbi:MAG: AbrB/MazE/SpoVT family DNA-binding domain-containing protein [Candidatus Omnitrophica bacterium]|nr:AbrB/MazE/SpoVT family DNA-binding domain-containing protein [Candidatus Omnitrophota bacterium]